MLHKANDNDDDVVTLLLRPHHEARLSGHHPPPARRRRRWSSRNGSDDDDDDLPSSTSSRLFAKVVVRDNNTSIMTKNDIPAQLLTNSNNTQDKGSDSGDPIRCLLLCTKANDAINALEGVWERLVVTSSSSSSSSSSTHSSSSSSLTTEKKKKNNDNDVSKVIILSNGALAIRDAIYKRFGCDNNRTTTTTTTMCDDDGRIMIGGVHIVLASTTHGAYRNNPSSSSDASLLNNNVVNNNSNRDEKYNTNNDELFVGYYDITHAGIGSTTSSYIEFSNACRHSSSSMIGGRAVGTVHTVSDVDMELALWRKLAANCVVNPLTAIHDIRNGTLLDRLLGDMTMRNQMRGILKEVSDVAIREMKNNSRNYYNSNSNNNDSLTSTTTSVVEESLSVSSLEEFTFRVMCDTRNNISSMLQDVKAGRITEIQYLNGYITSLGKEKYDLDCPYNAEMCRLLMGS
jgi:ketopantoate reductase